VFSLFTSSQGSPLWAHWLQMSYKYASSVKARPIQRRLSRQEVQPSSLLVDCTDLDKPKFRVASMQ